MANPMKREGLLPQLGICFAIYTSVVLAQLAGDPDECLISMPSIAGEIALECNREIRVV